MVIDMVVEEKFTKQEPVIIDYRDHTHEEDVFNKIDIDLEYTYIVNE